MDRLGPEQRHGLLARYIDRAKINWAHICVASLMASGYVNRILTTNFDPLLVQACAMFGEFPAVYDFAASQFLKAHMIPVKALFYLHGQRSGFVLKNTPEEMKKHAKFLKPIIDDSLASRVWIVAGYSGLSDPVFEILSSIDEFDYGLYWVGYKEQDPAEHVLKKLLKVKGKRAYLIRGYDADQFFDELIRELKIYPPKLVAKPFTHLNEFLNRVTPEEKFKETREMIRKAIEQFEQMTVVVRDAGVPLEDNFVSQAHQLMNASDYDGVIRMRPKHDAAPSEAGADYLSRAYLLKGNEIFDKARISSAPDDEKLFSQVIEQYKAALAIRHDFIEALNRWGDVLYNQACRKEGASAATLLKDSVTKFDRAIEVKPDYCEALINRGGALADLAVLKKGRHSSGFFKLAVKDFTAALASKPNSHEALTKWGDALRKLAATSPTKRARVLLDQAAQKYQESLKINREDVGALIGWGDVLLLKSQAEDSERPQDLVDEAIEKFTLADMSQPGSSSYYLARLKALDGDAWGCQEYLQKAKHFNRLPAAEYILNEPAFAYVRDLDWFKELLEQP